MAGGMTPFRVATVVNTDGGLLDEDTLPIPEVGPTEPPASSPVPTLVGNIRSILGSFDAIPTADRYRIYIDTAYQDVGGQWRPDGGEPSEDNLHSTITATQFQITHFDAAGTIPIDPTKQYFVAVSAGNELGFVPAYDSQWVGPVALRAITDEDIAASYVYAGEVTADQIQAGTLSSVVNLAGKFTTRGGDEAAPGGELDSVSLRGYGLPEVEGEPAPLLFEFPFVPVLDENGNLVMPPNYFSGDIDARKFTAQQGADFYGDANVIKGDGSLVLESGQGGDVGGPQIAQFVPSAPLAVGSQATPDWWANPVNPRYDRMRGLFWHSFTDQLYVIENTGGGCYVWRIDPDANTIDFHGLDTAGYEMAGMVISNDGTLSGRMVRPIGGTNWGWWTPEADGWVTGFYSQASPVDAFPIIARAQNGDVRIAENVNGRLRITVVNGQYSTNPSLGAVTTSSASYLPGNVTIGSLEIDSAGSQVGNGGYAYAVTTRSTPNTPVRIAGSAGSGLPQLPDWEWPVPTGMVGVVYRASGTPGWYGLGLDGRLYRFGGNQYTGPTSRHVAAVSMATSDAETQVGTKVAFQWKSRHTVSIQGPDLTPAATREGIYLYQGAGTPIDANMKRQGYTATGDTTLTLASFNPSGAAPGTAPTAGAFPLVPPARIVSDATDDSGPLIKIPGDGDDWRLYMLKAAACLDSGELAASANGVSGSVRFVREGGLKVLAKGMVTFSQANTSFVSTGIVAPPGLRPGSTENGDPHSPFNNTGTQYQFRIQPSGDLQVRNTAPIAAQTAVTLPFIAPPL